MTQPVTLPIFCPHCGGALSVEIEPFPRRSSAPVDVLKADPTGEELPEEEDAITTWPCLYCRKLNHAKLDGRFRWVTKGHDEKARNQ